MAPATGGVAERLIEPARLRPNRSMQPWRGAKMIGTRVTRAVEILDQYVDGD